MTDEEATEFSGRIREALRMVIDPVQHRRSRTGLRCRGGRRRSRAHRHDNHDTRLPCDRLSQIRFTGRRMVGAGGRVRRCGIDLRSTLDAGHDDAGRQATPRYRMTAGSTNAAAPAETQDTVALTQILVTGLGALATAGQADLACRLAGQACAVVRTSDPVAWQRLNVFLHKMIKHVADTSPT